MVIYATAASCSVGDMFLGGYVPGILLTVVLLIMNWFISKKRGYEPTRTHKLSPREILRITGKDLDKQTKNAACAWASSPPLSVLP